MAKIKLTKRAVDALEWKSGGPAQAFLWDEALTGFGVYVLESGKKTFVVQFRAGGKSRRIKIARYGVVTVDQAREKAREVLARVALDGDYHPPRPQEEAAPRKTVAAVAGEFIEHASAVRKRATADAYRRNLSLHVLPRIGEKALVDVTTADLASIHAAMRPTPILANRTLDAFASLWSYASRMGAAPAGGVNPARGVSRYRESARDRFMSDEETVRLGDALRTVENERRIDVFAVAAIKLLLLTGGRLREVLHARWEWIDWERGILRLPDSKTGKKVIVLSAHALAVLQALPRIEGNHHIFPGQKAGAPRSGLFDAWKIIRAEAGLNDVRLHDLRHSHASVAAGEGVGLPVIGRLLGHSKAQTTLRYAHLSDTPLRRASDAIGDRIGRALAGDSAGRENPPVKPERE